MTTYYTVQDSLTQLKELDELIERKVNRMVKEAVAMELGNRPTEAKNHGKVWDSLEEGTLIHSVLDVVYNHAAHYSRTRQAVVMRLLKYFKSAYTQEWDLVNKHY